MTQQVNLYIAQFPKRKPFALSKKQATIIILVGLFISGAYGYPAYVIANLKKNLTVELTLLSTAKKKDLPGRLGWPLLLQRAARKAQRMLFCVQMSPDEFPTKQRIMRSAGASPFPYGGCVRTGFWIDRVLLCGNVDLKKAKNSWE